MCIFIPEISYDKACFGRDTIFEMNPISWIVLNLTSKFINFGCCACCEKHRRNATFGLKQIQHCHSPPCCENKGKQKIDEKKQFWGNRKIRNKIKECYRNNCIYDLNLDQDTRNSLFQNKCVFFVQTGNKIYTDCNNKQK